MVAGYVVMRVAVLVQWVRVVRNNPQYRVVGKTYIACITVAQTGWVLILFLPLDALSFAIFAIIVLIIDWAGPSIADAKAVKHGSLPLPWNAHHVAERYSLLAIIALGETVFGTLAAAQSITKEEGWSVVSVTVIGLGVIMTFALWWVYFMVPSAPILAVRRDKARPWSFGHMAVFASIAAIGAGLHVIGYVYDSHYHVSVTAAIVAIAVPVLGLMLSLYSVHAWLVSAFPRNSPLQLGVLSLPVLAIILAIVGVPLWACLSLVVLSPVAIVFSYELGAWRTLEDQLARVVERAKTSAIAAK